MSAFNTHENLHASIIKFCKDRAAELVTAGTFKAGAIATDLEQYSQMSEIPDVDLIGLGNFGWIDEDRTYKVMASISVSTFADQGMFRHNKALGYLTSGFLKVGKIITLVDADDGTPIQGVMVIERGMALLPCLKTTTRSVQSILVTFQAVFPT